MEQIGQRLADAGACFNNQRPLRDQRLCHRHRHFLLLRPKFEVACFAEQPFVREDFADPLDKLDAACIAGCAAAAPILSQRNHCPCEGLRLFMVSGQRIISHHRSKLQKLTRHLHCALVGRKLSR